MSYWVYILLCDNFTYYTGYTTNLQRRYQEHVLGTAKCKYTRSFKPIAIMQAWEVFGKKSLAMKMERYIKKLTKQEKENVIAFPQQLVELFAQAAIIYSKESELSRFPAKVVQ